MCSNDVLLMDNSDSKIASSANYSSLTVKGRGWSKNDPYYGMAVFP
jgi:hypothetical protein